MIWILQLDLLRLLLPAHGLIGALGDLSQPALVVLALGREHLQLLFQVLQSLLDGLLAAVSLLVSRLQRARQVLAVLRESAQLLVFATERRVQLGDQLILALQLLGQPPQVLAFSWLEVVAGVVLLHPHELLAALVRRILSLVRVVFAEVVLHLAHVILATQIARATGRPSPLLLR